MLKKLNAKHRIFCNEYVRNGYNKINAYIVAYGKKENTLINYNSVRVLANRLLKNRLIHEEIKKIEKKNLFDKMNNETTYKRILFDIATGNSERLVNKKRGEEYITLIEKPTTSEQINAIKELNKMNNEWW